MSNLSLAGDVTVKPEPHTAFFVGEHPCDNTGTEIVKIKHSSARQTLGQDLIVDHSFSSRPREGYADYYEKMTTYIAIISGPAESIDPAATAKTFPVITDDEEESVFRYIDTASSRVGINVVSDKLKLKKVAILGLGGTGSYVLDLVAKTPVQEIHLFDGDRFSQHNAFRSPGAPSVDELRAKPQKVAFLHERYDKMHRGIVAHHCYVDGSNVDELRGMDFAFLCLDQGAVRRLVAEKLQEFGVAFVDVGVGIYMVDEALAGNVRVTTSTNGKRDHVAKSVSFSESAGADDYSHNIQIADLNALNAALAVIKWKKLFGFYKDLEHEHQSIYTIDGNTLDNDETV